MIKKLLFSFVVLVFFAAKVFSQSPASAVWQPASSSNIPGSVVATGDIQANEQGGTLEAYTYSTTVTAVSDATGWQRTRSSATAPCLPFGNVHDSNFYLEYRVKPATGKYLRVTDLSLSILGGGTGNCRVLVKYSKDGTNFSNMPVSGSYFLVDGTAASYAATEAEPVVLINTGGTALPESKRRLTFTGINVNLELNETFYVRVYPYLTDLTQASARYLMSRQMVISALSSATTLPLDFLSFTAKPSALGKTVNLDWKTNNEGNTKNFEVQSRTANTEFKTIGFVDSRNTAGVHNYSFTDSKPLASTVYYRLKQVDNDGKFKYSDVVSANVKSSLSVKIYPNPVVNVLSVSHPSEASRLAIVNLQGKKLIQQTIALNATSTEVNVSSLQTGTYIIMLEGKGIKSSLKFVKK